MKADSEPEARCVGVEIEKLKAESDDRIAEVRVQTKI